MEGFKPFKKVQCFKEGGSVQKEVNFTKRDRKVVDSADMAQDKKIVKKAFSIHDTQQHEEKTDLKSLKKGGRAKKDCGTVKKFKTGGTVTNVYEAKKASGDKDNIKKVKAIVPAKLCGGKSVKKMADGGGVMGSIGDAIGGEVNRAARGGDGATAERADARERERASRHSCAAVVGVVSGEGQRVRAELGEGAGGGERGRLGEVARRGVKSDARAGNQVETGQCIGVEQSGHVGITVVAGATDAKAYASRRDCRDGGC